MTTAYHTLAADEQCQRAADLASVLHAGQVDKNGAPYIHHPAAVAQMAMSTARADGLSYDDSMILAAIGWLHDVIEDTPMTTEGLLLLGFPSRIVRGVAAMTHAAGEPREDYYRRVRHSADALRVKRADIEHNTMTHRLARLDRRTAARLTAKYAKACEALGFEDMHAVLAQEAERYSKETS